jgi:hypothetical protein
LGSKPRSNIRALSISLGLEESQTLDLCICCIGGTPRVIEYTVDELMTKSHSLGELLERIMTHVALNYPRPSKELVLAALGNVRLPPDQNLAIGSQSLTLVQLICSGYCQDNSRFQDRAILSSPYLLSAAYSDSQEDQNFTEALKEFLMIPMSRANIWEEFVRKLLIVRSFNFHGETSIKLKALFEPALFTNAWEHVEIQMGQLTRSLTRFNVPPTPQHVRLFRASIWCSTNEFEPEVDSLMFFHRSGQGGDGDQRLDQICVGIHNQWFKSDETLSISDMVNASQRFIAKMRVRGWTDSQLFMIFIVNRDFHSRNRLSYRLEDNLPGNVAIISTDDQALYEWLSPSLRGMVERVMYPTQLSECHCYDSKLSKEEYAKYKKDIKKEFEKIQSSLLASSVTAKRKGSSET